MYTLPIIPLQTTLFPKTPIHLHIFEESYNKMIRQILETNSLFGVCLLREEPKIFAHPQERRVFGCSARVIDLSSTSEGGLNLTAIGEERFVLHRFIQRFPYLIAEVENAPYQQSRTLDILRMKNMLVYYLSEYVRLLDKHQSIDIETELLMSFVEELKEQEDPTNVIFMTASLMQIPTMEKQRLLEIETIPQLLVQIIQILRREILLQKRFFFYSKEWIRNTSLLN